MATSREVRQVWLSAPKSRSVWIDISEHRLKKEALLKHPSQLDADFVEFAEAGGEEGRRSPGLSPAESLPALHLEADPSPAP